MSNILTKISTSLDGFKQYAQKTGKLTIPSPKEIAPTPAFSQLQSQGKIVAADRYQRLTNNYVNALAEAHRPSLLENMHTELAESYNQLLGELGSNLAKPDVTTHMNNIANQVDELGIQIQHNGNSDQAQAALEQTEIHFNNLKQTLKENQIIADSSKDPILIHAFNMNSASADLANAIKENQTNDSKEQLASLLVNSTSFSALLTNVSANNQQQTIATKSLDDIAQQFKTLASRQPSKYEANAKASLDKLNNSIKGLSAFSCPDFSTEASDNPQGLQHLNDISTQVSSLADNIKISNPLDKRIADTQSAIDALNTMPNSVDTSTQLKKVNQLEEASSKLGKQVESTFCSPTPTAGNLSGLANLTNPMNAVSGQISQLGDQVNSMSNSLKKMPSSPQELQDGINQLQSNITNAQSQLNSFDPINNLSAENPVEKLQQQAQAAKQTNPFTQYSNQIGDLQQSLQSQRDRLSQCPCFQDTIKNPIDQQISQLGNIKNDLDNALNSNPLEQQIPQVQSMRNQIANIAANTPNVDIQNQLHDIATGTLGGAQACLQSALPKPIPGSADIAVVSGAKLQCPMGDGPKTVRIPSLGTKADSGKEMMSILNVIPMLCIPSFGMCKCPSNPMVAAATAAAMGALTPQKCIPIVAPFMPGAIKTYTFGTPVTQKSNTTMCMWGPAPTFTDAGQDDVEVI